jgi:hypothetical protein
VYESVYLTQDCSASTNLEKAILQLYTAILQYLAKAVEVSTCECYLYLYTFAIVTDFSSGNVARCIFAVEELSQSIGKIEANEIAVEHDCNAAEAQCKPLCCISN